MLTDKSQAFYLFMRIVLHFQFIMETHGFWATDTHIVSYSISWTPVFYHHFKAFVSLSFLFQLCHIWKIQTALIFGVPYPKSYKSHCLYDSFSQLPSTQNPKLYPSQIRCKVLIGVSTNLFISNNPPTHPTALLSCYFLVHNLCWNHLFTKTHYPWPEYLSIHNLPSLFPFSFLILY